MKREVKRKKGKGRKVVVGQWLVVSVLSSALFFLSTVHYGLATVHAQAGGPYEIRQSVIASGGGSNAAGGTFRVDGTIGQNIAGTTSTGGGFSLRGGFWSFEPAAPTASLVSVSGRIRTADGFGIRSVVVTLTSPDGTARSMQTGTFGYFRFDDVTAGQTYIISIRSRRYSFPEPVRLIQVVETVTDADFTASPL